MRKSWAAVSVPGTPGFPAGQPLRIQPIQASLITHDTAALVPADEGATILARGQRIC
ncbi:MAG TPA: hypothetical protein VGF67_09115 [Ktedonobacteraceae bacterium]